MIEIIPAIIAQSYEDFEKKVKAVEPYVNRVHLDIMDGVFVDSKTISGVEELKKIDTPLGFGVHLMVQKPELILNEWLETKADLFFVHIESDVEINSFVNLVNLHGKQAGIVLNPESEIDRINGFAHMLSAVQFMTVNPGQYGAYFIDGVLTKISVFHSKYPHVKIYVDGGINPGTIKRAIEAGATAIVAGGYIFNHPDGPERAIEELKSSSN